MTSDFLTANKLVIAIPTFGRSWKINSDSGSTLIPPFTANGPGQEGPYLRSKGMLAYYEICPVLMSAANTMTASVMLQKIPDGTQRLGTYAYRRNELRNGLWVSYDDTEVAGGKAYYAKMKGLGGVAVVDLTLDDFRGTCNSNRPPYPLLHAISGHL